MFLTGRAARTDPEVYAAVDNTNDNIFHFDMHYPAVGVLKMPRSPLKLQNHDSLLYKAHNRNNKTFIAT